MLCYHTDTFHSSESRANPRGMYITANGLRSLEKVGSRVDYVIYPLRTSDGSEEAQMPPKSGASELDKRRIICFHDENKSGKDCDKCFMWFRIYTAILKETGINIELEDLLMMY